MLYPAESFKSYRTYELQMKSDNFARSIAYWIAESAKPGTPPQLAAHFTSNAVGLLIARQGMLTELEKRKGH